MALSLKEKQEIAKAWQDLPESERTEYVDFAIEEGAKRANAVKSAFTIFASDFLAMKRQSAYRNGAVGMIRWVEEYVNFKVPVETQDGIIFKWLPVKNLPAAKDKYGRSYKTLWEHGKRVLKQALVMEKGKFKRNLVVLCWPRGDGKSFLAILIALHRFFCFPHQRIYLTGISKDESGDNLLGEMIEIIQNSSKLYEIVGPKGLLTETIRMTRQGARYNFIKLLSGYTGLKSNASMVVQTEAFKVADDTFFTEWYGSLRNTPNAMGVIDTTVSDEKHWLHRLYRGWLKDPNELIFFSYRYSKDGHPKDYVHPGMTKAQLDNYRRTFSEHNFQRFFLNLWKTTSNSVFSEKDLEIMGLIGIDGSIGNHREVLKLLKTIDKGSRQKEMMLERLSRGGHVDQLEGIEWGDDVQHRGRLWTVDSEFDLGNEIELSGVRTTTTPITLASIQKLTEIYRTHWALLVGVDMSDALKSGTRMKARTVISWMLKGLPYSIGKRKKDLVDAQYIYFLGGIADFLDHQPSSVNVLIRSINDNLGGIQMITGETYGLAHIAAYCKDLEIPLTSKHPNIRTQNVGFSELIMSVQSGHFKAPTIPITGMKEKDILREEMGVFNVVSRGANEKYGSPYKGLRNGIQDDTIDSIGWGIYGGLDLQADTFKIRRKGISTFWGQINSPALIQDHFIKNMKDSGYGHRFR